VVRGACSALTCALEGVAERSRAVVGVRASRNINYEYISERRLEELEATSSSRLGGLRRIQGFSFSALGFGVGGSRGASEMNKFERQLRALLRVERDLEKRGDVGAIESEARYVRHTMPMAYSQWNFPDAANEMSRTAAIWYGQDAEHQVMLRGNPAYLRGFPDAAFGSRIPLGTAQADPSWGAAVKAARLHLLQLATRASSDETEVEVTPIDLENPDLARHVSNLACGLDDRMSRGVEEGVLPETIWATRRFLAQRVSSLRDTFLGAPVYVAEDVPATEELRRRFTSQRPGE
jgi:hypothetical protein